MASHGGKAAKKEIDPEELLRRKFRAKCLFRALGRLVMANTYWLIEGIDHYEGLEDVKRRVEQAVRSKAKKKQLLSITDKALLNKPAYERTEREKQYLYRIIGGLKCFKRYPNNVKRRLAAVTYFKYYGPGRTIVRQHHEAHALYFIVSGDVAVSQMILDELLQQYVSVEIGTMHPGDLFGEVSLLHNIPRTATVVTTGHCELLTLMKEDFKNVLQVSVQKQWDEVRKAMSAFTYFDGLDEVARREGCIMAKMKSYAPNETLLGDGVGVPNFVYFILSGRCQMIESLQVVTTKHLGRSYYQLYDPYVPKVEIEQDLDTKYFDAYNKDSRISTAPGVKEEPSQIEQETNAVNADLSSDNELVNDGLKTLPSAFKQERVSISTKRDSNVQIIENEEQRLSIVSSTSRKSQSQILMQPSQHRSSLRLSLLTETVPSEIPPENLCTYFMQVCQLNSGSSFGFGENMRDRRIVALTPVNCMLLPKTWLLQRNTANIWTRIEHYLEKKIPTKRKLFKNFVAERRWQEFKDQTVGDVVARSNTLNFTTIHDVPYSIRMEEMFDP